MVGSAARRRHRAGSRAPLRRDEPRPPLSARRAPLRRRGSGRPLGTAGRVSSTEYHSYLLIDDLLRQQRPLTTGAPDELLFIVVHQVYELWFRVVVDELIHARDQLLAGRAHTAVKPLRRVLAVEGLLVDQLGVLETMGPEDFLAFRDPLAPASGFQSAQFRAIERLSGGVAGASST